MDLMRHLEALFPKWAMRRAQASKLKRYYDAGQTSPYFRRKSGGNTSADAVVSSAGANLRAIARYLDENSDLAHGILDTLEKKVIGTGLELRPMVKSTTGRPLERFNRQLAELWWDFAQAPEVTRELTMDEVQRVTFRTFCRDGEMLGHHVRGTNRLREATQVAYAIELLEADLLPFELMTSNESRIGSRRTVVNSVEKDAWGRPIAYHIYKAHPGNNALGIYNLQDATETKRVMAADIIHLKYTTRFRQTRGVPILAPVLRLMESIKDYSESEQVAARVNAALTAFITKSTDFAAPPGDTSEGTVRSYEMMPGMIYNDMLPGEDVKMISADRPNTNMNDFIQGMLRGAAAGTHTSYSEIARDYSGTYSSQRQEMVSTKIDYDLLRRKFINDFMNPVYREFLQMAITQGLLTVPRSVSQRTLWEPGWTFPPQPWIDPKKEADAWIAMHGAGLMSKAEIVAARGGDLDKLYTDLKMEMETEERLGLTPEPVAETPDQEQDQDDTDTDDDDQEAA